MKRPLCFFLSLVLMLCAVLSLPGAALATQSRSDYFLGYTPTGNPAYDMAQLAMTQLGRTKAQFTYTEHWCADFVSDCAKILGQSEAVPFNGSCTYLYNAVINAGGYEVAAGSRQTGDLVFYNFDHVGIMSSYSNCVSGNMGVSRVEDWDYTWINSGSTIRIVRPNYKTILDVNFYVNGADTVAIDGIGSFSITVGGTTYSNQTDFCQRVPVGTSYSISNIQASSGYVYTGVSQGALSGTAGSDTYIRLNFASAYTVSYNANGGSGAPSAQKKTAGQALTLSSVKPTRSGYTFEGWATSSTATSAAYQPGGKYTADRSVTLYAVWSLNEYDITYDMNGGSGSIPKQHVTGKTATLSSVRPTRAHFNFLGWSKSKTAAAASYAPGATYSGSGNVTLYAVWKRKLDNVMILPSSLKSISSEAFLNTAADAFVVPKSVTEIGSKAFAGDIAIYGYSGSCAETYAKNNSITFIAITDGWVKEDAVPAGAHVTAEKWTYTLRTTETTTSKDPALEGWTKTGYTLESTPSSTGTVKYADFPSGYNQNDSVYQSYNHSISVDTETETTRRIFSDPSFWSYCYWHWCWVDSVGGSDRNVLIEDHYGTVNGKDYIYFDRIVTTFNMSTEGMSTSGLKSFDGLWSSYHHPDYNLPEYASWWWYRFTIWQQSYSDYAKIFTYTKTTDQSKESTKKPSGDGVINVQRWVKYSF